MTRRINRTLASIENGRTRRAIRQLQGARFLGKFDGCANSNPPEPEENDWITNCEEQAILYEMVLDTIAFLEAELGNP